MWTSYIIFSLVLTCCKANSENIRQGRHYELASNVDDESGGQGVDMPEAPSWVEEKAAMRSYIGEPYGERLQMNCRAKGSPTPTISWYMNGISIDEVYDPKGYIKVSQSIDFYSAQA